MDALLWDHSLSDDAKEVPQGLKPEEEIVRFTVNEQLSDTDRINLFLTGGQQVQQRKAIEGLPALLKSRGVAGWEAVRDNLLAALKQLDVDAQVATADGLRFAVQQEALAGADAAACLLPLAVGNTKAKDKPEEETEAWLQLLLELVPVVGSAQLQQHVLQLALAQGQVNEPVASRVVSCRLLGAMTAHLPPVDALAGLALKLVAACQDTDYQVRISAAEQLPGLARVLGPAASVDKLLPELAELLDDDEVQVRMAALNSLVVLCELLPHDARMAHLLPLVRRHMQPLELELPLQRTLAAAFPRLLAAIRDDLEPSDAGIMYSCFRHLAARTDLDLRRTCARCVSDLMVAPLPGSSPSYLHDTWTDLALDHDQQVRVAVARQLHAMAQHVAPSDAARLLRRPLAALLRDSSPQVREALLAGLADTLQALAHVDDLHREGLASDIHQGLLVLQGNITDSWRCQQHLAAALPHLTSLLGPDQLAEHWAPYAFGLLLNGAAAVKPTAAHGLAALLRGCRRERPRTDLYCQIMRELAWGRSCFARLAFIQLCVAALAAFSCRWFKEHLLLGVMELLSDAVPNVRLAALGLLPALKQTIRLPEDVQQLEQLNSTMSNLMTDNDRDVAHAARSLHATFKRTPLRMTGGAGLLDINGSSSGAAAAEFEVSDKAKEEGEADLTLAAEDLDRLSVEWAAVNAERKGRRNPLLAFAGECTSTSTTSSSNNAVSSGTGSPTAARLAANIRAANSGTGVGGVGLCGGSNSNSKLLCNSPAGVGGSSSSSSALLGLGRTTTAMTGPSSASAASSNWGVAYDRRFGSGPASSSSSSSSSTQPGGNNGLSIRTGATTTAAAAAFGSTARVGAGRNIGTVATSSSNNSSSSSSSLSSPRPGGLNTTSSNGPAGGGGLGFGPGSPLSSPTGSSLLAHMRLPVLGSGSGKTGATNTSGAQTGSNGGSSSNNSSSSSSPASLMGASRLGWSGGLGSSGYQAATAATAGGGAAVGPSAAGSRQPPGSLSASQAAAAAASRPGASGGTGSLFARAGDAAGKASSTSSSSSSRAGAAPGKSGAGVFGGSSSGSSGTTTKGVAASRGGGSAAANVSSQAKDAVARRFR